MAYANRYKPSQPRSSVFISYARSDGEAFAHRLRQQLEKQQIKLWQDRVALEGGRDWWLQITEALDNVQFMALVVTPNALKSEIVRKEWRYAQQQRLLAVSISLLYTPAALCFSNSSKNISHNRIYKLPDHQRSRLWLYLTAFTN